jgi:hypothetical protein
MNSRMHAFARPNVFPTGRTTDADDGPACVAVDWAAAD